MTSDIHNTTAASAAAQDDPFIVRASAFMRLATDQTGKGPSAATLGNYVRHGLLPALWDSSGRLLFRASDAQRALQIYLARKDRHGDVGRKAPGAGS